MKTISTDPPSRKDFSSSSLDLRMARRLKNLQHVAIIPDGNRRWAESKGLPGTQGHIAGAKTVRKILKAAYEMKIDAVTLWAGSYDNLTKRSKSELTGLFKIYHKLLSELKKDPQIHEDQIRVKVIGEWDAILPKKTTDLIDQIQSSTKKYSNHSITICIGYNGDRAMLNAIDSYCNVASPKRKISADQFEKHLASPGELPIDLVIRTGAGGVPHNSNGFMMWETRNAYLYFTDTPWPAFSPAQFAKVCERYDQEKRRYGK